MRSVVFLSRTSCDAQQEDNENNNEKKFISTALSLLSLYLSLLWWTGGISGWWVESFLNRHLATTLEIGMSGRKAKDIYSIQCVHLKQKKTKNERNGKKSMWKRVTAKVSIKRELQSKSNNNFLFHFHEVCSFFVASNVFAMWILIFFFLPLVYLK